MKQEMAWTVSNLAYTELLLKMFDNLLQMRHAFDAGLWKSLLDRNKDRLIQRQLQEFLNDHPKLKSTISAHLSRRFRSLIYRGPSLSYLVRGI